MYDVLCVMYYVLCVMLCVMCYVLCVMCYVLLHADESFLVFLDWLEAA